MAQYGNISGEFVIWGTAIFMARPTHHHERYLFFSVELF